MLPKNKRVNTALFKKILKNGKKFYSNFFLLKILRVEDKESRFSFVVSVKVDKKAAKRNLIKRRGRYIVAKHWNDIKPNFAVVVFVKTEAKKLTFTDFEDCFLSVLQSANLLK